MLQCAEDEVLDLGAEFPLIDRAPEAFTYDHQANIIAFFRQLRERFDAIVKAFVFANESKEQEDVLLQSMLPFPFLFVEVRIGFKKSVYRVIEFEDES